MTEPFIIGEIISIQGDMVGLRLCTGKEIQIYRSNFVGEIEVSQVIIKSEEKLGKFSALPKP
jgi:hypothetical protein